MVINMKSNVANGGIYLCCVCIGLFVDPCWRPSCFHFKSHAATLLKLKG